jgi:hypothetical protein
MVINTAVAMNFLCFIYFIAKITLIIHNYNIKKSFKKYQEIIESYYKNLKRALENILE